MGGWWVRERPRGRRGGRWVVDGNHTGGVRCATEGQMYRHGRGTTGRRGRERRARGERGARGEGSAVTYYGMSHEREKKFHRQGSGAERKEAR